MGIAKQAWAGVAAILSFGGAASAEVTVGELAPAFSLPGSDGRVHSLDSHKGQRAVVLAWFPKAFTPG